MSSIEFVVPGSPIAWARARTRGGRVFFTPAKQRGFASVVAQFARIAMRGKQPLDGPVELTVVAVYEWPKTWSRAKRAKLGCWKTSKPDADNIGKMVGDALNTLAWTDDARIARLEVQKIYSANAELRVYVKPLVP